MCSMLWHTCCSSSFKICFVCKHQNTRSPRSRSMNLHVASLLKHWAKSAQVSVEEGKVARPWACGRSRLRWIKVLILLSSPTCPVPSATCSNDPDEDAHVSCYVYRKQMKHAFYIAYQHDGWYIISLINIMCAICCILILHKWFLNHGVLET